MTEPVNGNNLYLPTDDQAKKNTTQAFNDPDTFLKILVAQMKYQNPMDPMDSSTFVDQLTQMATMEQMYNVGRSMDNLASRYESSRYYEMIGQQVSLTKDDEVITGRVGGVIFDEGQPYFYLAGAPDGERYTLDQINSITGKAGSDSDILPFLALIGMQVKVSNGRDETTGIVEKVIMQNGNASLQVNGETYRVDQLLEVFNAANNEIPDIPEEAEENTGFAQSPSPETPEPGLTG